MCRAPEVSANPNANPPVQEVDATQTKQATSQKNNAKLYAPVVTLSINDHHIKFLESIKQGFKRTISWNKYRSEITTEPENNNLDYMTGPIFKDINRLFVLLFKNGNNKHARDSFDKYYMPLQLTVDIANT